MILLPVFEAFQQQVTSFIRQKVNNVLSLETLLQKLQQFCVIYTCVRGPLEKFIAGFITIVFWEIVVLSFVIIRAHRQA